MNQTAFVAYLMDFYGPRGVYRFNFSVQEIKQATALYRAGLKNKGDGFVGDSIDRERVRDIVLGLREGVA